MTLFWFSFFKRFIVFFINAYTTSLQKEHTKSIFLNKITNRTQSKQFITGKGSYILSYKFQREDLKNLIVFFYVDMTIVLIKYCFKVGKCQISEL
jgi:hypothetical protein